MGVSWPTDVTVDRLMLLGVGDDFVVRLVGAVDDHGVDIGDVQHFGCLQTVQPEVLDRDNQLDPLIIRHDNVPALSVLYILFVRLRRG